ncbi:TetR-like C-terminal domain-containing protein [Paracoccus sp. M683]|uniref:TetR-like C-terminal domain-containing protein n=1 Tax=Paracoccus sp. M683 TaxID=2594268 RepID=UPI00163D71D4|nr:TetR-like C-terminal domain-containing protein [Paracoccus sp. M683]
MHDSVSQALLELIAEHRPSFPDLGQIADRAGQDEQAVREVFGSVQDILDTLAEQGLIKLFDNCLRTVTRAPHDDPVAQFGALGSAYLDWAFENPDQFRLLQHAKLVDLEGNERLARYIRSMHDLMIRLLNAAKEKGQIPDDADNTAILIAGRCLLFGLARMALDGNMTEWHAGLTGYQAAHRVFENYMETMAVANVRLTARSA